MRILRPAMMTRFIRIYASHLPHVAAGQPLARGDIKLGAFMAWLRADHQDATFKSHATFWALEVLPAMQLFYDSLETCNWDGYMCSRKTFLPYLAARNKYNYFRLVLWDLANIHTCVPAPRVSACFPSAIVLGCHKWRLKRRRRYDCFQMPALHCYH